MVVVCRLWLLLKRSFLFMKANSSILHVLDVMLRLNLLMFIVFSTADANAWPFAAFYLMCGGL